MLLCELYPPTAEEKSIKRVEIFVRISCTLLKIIIIIIIYAHEGNCDAKSFKKIKRRKHSHV